jgi:hypothetical protein
MMSLVVAVAAMLSLHPGPAMTISRIGGSPDRHDSFQLSIPLIRSLQAVFRPRS